MRPVQHKQVTHSPIAMYRRKFIHMILGSSLALALIGYVPSAFPRVFLTKKMLSAMPAFLDTLLPEYDSPSATQLGADRQLLNYAATVDNYLRLLQLGCQWLDQQALSTGNKTFAQLSPEIREDIVRAAEASPENSVQRLFFERVKSDIFRFYYTNPASWPAIGFNGPIQPIGFPDFATEPKVRS